MQIYQNMKPQGTEGKLIKKTLGVSDEMWKSVKKYRKIVKEYLGVNDEK